MQNMPKGNGSVVVRKRMPMNSASSEKPGLVHETSTQAYPVRNNKLMPMHRCVSQVYGQTVRKREVQKQLVCSVTQLDMLSRCKIGMLTQQLKRSGCDS